MGFGMNFGAFANSALRTYSMMDEIMRRNSIEEQRQAELERQRLYAQSAAAAVENSKYATASYTLSPASEGQSLTDPEFGIKAAYPDGGNYGSQSTGPGFGLRRIVGENAQPDMGVAYQGMIQAAGAYGQPQALANTVSQYAGYMNTQQGRDDALRRERQSQSNWELNRSDNLAEQQRQQANLESGRAIDASTRVLAQDNWQKKFDEDNRRAQIAEEAADAQRQRDESRHYMDKRAAQRQADDHATKAADAARKASYQEMVNLGTLLQQTEEAERNFPQQFEGATAGALKQFMMSNGERVAAPFGLPQGMQVSGERVGPGQYRMDFIDPQGHSVQSRAFTADMLQRMGNSGLGVKSDDNELVPVTGSFGPKDYKLKGELRQELANPAAKLTPEQETQLRAEVSVAAKARNPWGPDSWRSEDAMRQAYGPTGSQAAWEAQQYALREKQMLQFLKGSSPPSAAPPSAPPPGAPAPSAAPPSRPPATKSASEFVRRAMAAGATKDQAMSAARSQIAAGSLLDDLR